VPPRGRSDGQGWPGAGRPQTRASDDAGRETADQVADLAGSLIPSHSRGTPRRQRGAGGQTKRVTGLQRTSDGIWHTGGLSGARRTDHSQPHPSPTRERSKGPSAPEAKPLPTLAYRCLRNAATYGKCFLRVHVAMVEFLSQDRPLTGCERAAALRQHLRRRNRARPPASATRPSTPRPARGETPRMRQAFRSPPIGAALEIVPNHCRATHWAGR
jgi:hypothetical protein